SDRGGNGLVENPHRVRHRVRGGMRTRVPVHARRLGMPTTMTTSSKPEDRSGIDWFLTIAVLAVAATFVRAIFFTPVEARQGAAQKIFYVHAPSAFIGLYVAFGIVAVAGALYLWLRDERLDRVAASSAEVGVMYMTVVLITGPLW